MSFREFTATFHIGGVSFGIQSWFSFGVKMIIRVMYGWSVRFKNISHLKCLDIPFLSINATFSVCRSSTVSVSSFPCMSEFFILLIHSSSPADMSHFLPFWLKRPIIAPMTLFRVAFYLEFCTFHMWTLFFSRMPLLGCPKILWSSFTHVIFCHNIIFPSFPRAR